LPIRRTRGHLRAATEGDPEEYRYHLGTTHASKVPAAIEFIDVHKSFGRNHVLRGLNMEVPEGQSR